MGIQTNKAGLLAWWPLLLAPAVVVLVLLTRDTPAGAVIRTHDAGPLPPLLPLLAGGVALVGAVWRRSPLLWLCAALGLLFFLREASLPGTDKHLPGIKKGVYVGLGLLVVWAVVWRERLGPWVRRPGVFPLAVSMWVMYGLSQAIARGALKFVSDLTDASGQKLRTPMEECCETAGHLLLLGLVVWVWVCVSRRAGAAPSAEPAGEGTGAQQKSSGDAGLPGASPARAGTH